MLLRDFTETIFMQKLPQSSLNFSRLNEAVVALTVEIFAATSSKLQESFQVGDSELNQVFAFSLQDAVSARQHRNLKPKVQLFPCAQSQYFAHKLILWRCMVRKRRSYV